MAEPENLAEMLADPRCDICGCDCSCIEAEVTISPKPRLLIVCNWCHPRTSRGYRCYYPEEYGIEVCRRIKKAD